MIVDALDLPDFGAFDLVWVGDRQFVRGEREHVREAGPSAVTLLLEVGVGPGLAFDRTRSKLLDR